MGGALIAGLVQRFAVAGLSRTGFRVLLVVVWCKLAAGRGW